MFKTWNIQLQRGLCVVFLISSLQDENRCVRVRAHVLGFWSMIPITTSFMEGRSPPLIFPLYSPCRAAETKPRQCVKKNNNGSQTRTTQHNTIHHNTSQHNRAAPPANPAPAPSGREQ